MSRINIFRFRKQILFFMLIVFITSIAHTQNLSKIERKTKEEFKGIRDAWYATELIKTDRDKEYKRWCRAVARIEQLEEKGVVVTGTANKFHLYGGEITGDEFIDKLMSSDYDTLLLEYVRISGEVYLSSGWGWEKIVDKLVNLQSCTFLDKCHIGATFKKKVLFENCIFKAHTFFWNEFEENAYFLKNTFESTASLNFVAHFDSVYVCGSRFKENVEFGGIVLYINFGSIHLDRINGVYDGGTQWEPAIFNGDVSFYFGQYNKLIMDEVTFKNRLSFTHMALRTLSFESARILGSEFIFFGSSIADSINFQNMITAGLLNMSKLGIGTNCRILLKEISFNNLKCRWSQLNNKLCFENSASISDVKRVYYTLHDNFRREGARFDANECLYSLKEIERKYEKITWNPLSWLRKFYLYSLWLISGYLLKPTHTVLFALCIVIIFSLLYMVTPGYILSITDVRNAARHQLMSLSKKYLKDRLSNLHAKTSGNKCDLIERILVITRDKNKLLKLAKHSNTISLKYYGICCLYSIATFIRFSIIIKDLHIYGWHKKCLNIIEAIIGWFTLAVFIITCLNATFI